MNGAITKPDGTLLFWGNTRDKAYLRDGTNIELPGVSPPDEGFDQWDGGKWIKSSVLAKREAMREWTKEMGATEGVALARKVEDLIDFLSDTTGLSAEIKTWHATRKEIRGRKPS
jgi:hypothetical protein